MRISAHMKADVVAKLLKMVRISRERLVLSLTRKYVLPCKLMWCFQVGIVVFWEAKEPPWEINMVVRRHY